VMRAFAAGEVQVLVSTTVIEVGIDVANATVMVIEHAERFGLAQLHQLRGRVGRGAHRSVCVLLHQEPPGEAGEARLRASWRPRTGSSSPSATSNCAVPATSSAPANPGCRRCGLAIWCAIGRSWSRPAASPPPRSTASPGVRWWRRPAGAGPTASAWHRSASRGIH